MIWHFLVFLLLLCPRSDPVVSCQLRCAAGLASVMQIQMYRMYRIEQIMHGSVEMTRAACCTSIGQQGCSFKGFRSDEIWLPTFIFGTSFRNNRKLPCSSYCNKNYKSHTPAISVQIGRAPIKAVCCLKFGICTKACSQPAGRGCSSICTDFRLVRHCTCKVHDLLLSPTGT